MATQFCLTNKAGRFMALCMGLAITASCTDDETVNGYAETDVLSFGVSISNEWNTPSGTRSAAEAQAWNASRFDGSELWLIASSEQNMDTTLFCSPKTRSEAVTTDNFYVNFGVYGYVYNGENWENGSNVKSYFTAEKVSKNNDLWIADRLRYWPGASYRMHFFAYAPYDMKPETATFSVNNNISVLSYKIPAEVTDQKDLVVATADVVGNHNQSVQLEFKHILTAVKVKIANDISGTVKRVALKNVNGSGSYTFGENSWTSVTGEKEFGFVRNVTLNPNAENGTFIADGEYTFMMIPQVLGERATLEVEFDNGEKLTGSLYNKVNWEIGRTVIYRISKTEINVEYEFSVINPSKFAGEGGSNPLEIKSFKTENGVNPTSVSWTNAGYYSKDDNNDYTELDIQDWFVFPTYQVDQTNYNVEVYSQYSEVTGQTGESSRITIISPDKDLQAMSEINNADEPINLAGTDRSETTANCYIVNAPGWYKFPIVYGNALKNGGENLGAYNDRCFVNHLDQQITKPWIKDNGITIGGAQLVWQDCPESAPFIEQVAVEGNYIKFYIPAGKTCVQGNAVIAVKDAAGNVAWSWHIWLTTHRLDDTFQFGDYHFFNALLGYREAELAICPEREVYVKLVQNGSNKEAYVHVSQDNLYQFVATGNAPYYQHGRKDPFPGASLKVDRTEDGKYSVNVVQGQDKIRDFGAEKVNENTTLGYVIKHPDTYIGQNDGNTNWYWYLGKEYSTEGNETGYKNLWDNNNVKTVYDPCPVGYKIPTNKALDAVAKTDKANVEYVNTGLYFINNKGLEDEQRFFLQILCSRGYEGDSNSYVSKSANASLHCSQSNGSTSAHYLNFNGKDYWLSHGTVCAGRCILPQKE